MTGIVAQNVGRTSGLIKAASGGGGTWTLIKTLTASTSATLSFVDGTSDVVLDSTYPIYVFKFINIHPGTDNAAFTFQANAAGGSGYNETITSTAVRAAHNEADTATALSFYDSGAYVDFQGQGTAFQSLAGGVGNGNDECCSGKLWLFNPSSTTFVKHWYANVNDHYYSNYSFNMLISGYFNTTNAIDDIQFKMSTGNIDAGKIKLYGLSDS